MPCPSCPAWFDPQQYATPEPVRPQVCPHPAVKLTNARLTSVTGVGVGVDATWFADVGVGVSVQVGHVLTEDDQLFWLVSA